MKFGFPVADKSDEGCIAVFFWSPRPEKGVCLSGLALDTKRFHGRFLKRFDNDFELNCIEL